MRRILFAWEMGDNFGHLVACLRVAYALRRRGHSVAFAVRNPRVAAELLQPAGFSFVQAPQVLGKVRISRPPVNVSEVLLGEGYADFGAVLGAVLAWRTLFQLTVPDVVVGEYAPTALLAAHTSRIGSIAMGNGFGIPTQSVPQPSIRPWETISQAQLQQADQTVNDVIARVRGVLGCEEAITLAQLYGNPIVCTFPELDPFPGRAEADYVGPLFAVPTARHLTWSGGLSRRILAYLREDMRGFAALIAALSSAEAESVCVVPGLESRHARRLSTDRLRIVNTPLALDTLLGQTDVFVSYGGSGVIGQALLAGVPLLIAPQLVEQQLNARCVSELGAAIIAESQRSKADFARMLDTLLSDMSFRNKAQAFARRYPNFCGETAADRAAQRIERVATSINADKRAMHA